MMQARIQLDREKFQLWDRRSTMEQRSERILAHRNVKRLQSTTTRAFQEHRLVRVTHRDDQGVYYFKSMSGALHAIPKGSKIVDTRTEEIPAAWLPAVSIEDVDEGSSDISEMDLHLGVPESATEPRWGVGIGAVLLVLLGIMLLYL